MSSPATSRPGTMRITLLGTGCPAVHPRRYGAAQLVEGGDCRLLVDCGNGCTQRLAEAGHDAAAPDALLVTHLHSDHLVDLWQLVVAGWHAGRPVPLRVFAPAPVVEHARTLRAAWNDERRQRMAYEARPNPDALDLDLNVIEPGDRLAFPGLEVEVVEVDHAPVAPAFGFIFRNGEHMLALSGDTAPSPGLVAAARGCDLLVHEVFVHGGLRPHHGVRSQATIDAVARYHTASSAIGGIATAADAKALLLTHLVPPDADPTALVAEIARDYRGPVIVGEDLMTVDLASRSVAWRGMTLGLGGPG